MTVLQSQRSGLHDDGSIGAARSTFYQDPLVVRVSGFPSKSRWLRALIRGNVVRMRTNGTQTTETPPIDYPKITIRGREYTLKYSLFAQYHLDKLNVNVADLMSTLIPRLPDGKPDPNPPMKPGRIVAMMTLLAACAAHNFADRGEPIWTADEWAVEIPDKLWGECCKAVAEAVVKARPAEVPVSPAPPETEAAGPQLQ